MNVIEKTKHDGAVKALKDRIDHLRFDLTNRNWEGICKNNHYSRLGEAITNANTLLCEMRETLDALQELEPNNK